MKQPLLENQNDLAMGAPGRANPNRMEWEGV